MRRSAALRPGAAVRGRRPAGLLSAAALLACASLGACGAGGPVGAAARDVVAVGGSTTLRPLSEAVAEDFALARPGARVAVGATGSLGGFRRLCAGEIDVAGASRAITAAEAARCRAAGTAYAAIPVARDGVAVVVHPDNREVGCLTLGDLARLWEPSSAVTTWRDLRPGLPAERIRLFAPGPDSGTFDFFTTVVVGRRGASRADHYRTEDDNLIARGVAGDRWALGYAGSAVHASGAAMLRAVAVDTGFGCALPSREAVADGSYSPLARELYIYVAVAALARSEVYDFADHYAAEAAELGAAAGYVPLPPAEYARGRALLAAARRESS